MTARGDSADARREDELDELVARCLERREAEGEVAVEALCRERPDLAVDLRRRLATLADAGFDALSTGGVPERFGDFRLVERLGQGGMGVVYRARQESLGREVALKIVRPEQLLFPGARERFQREIETVVRLRHPGLVPIHAVGAADGVPYYAMELVEGASLGDVLAAFDGRRPDQLAGADLASLLMRRAGRGGPPSNLFAGTWHEVVARIVREVAETLEHCHRRGVVHRDVKPSNVMLTPDGRVLLVDFGLSLSTDVERMTRTGSQLGSLPYMAPEQVDGRVGDIDGRTDVYGLGVMLYEACTLVLPHRAETLASLRAAILAGRVVPFATPRTRLGRDAATISAKAMAVEAHRRYPSAVALARDLDDSLAGRPISARPARAWERAWLWAHRQPAVAALVALLAIVPSVVAWRELRARRTIEDALGDAADARAKAEANFADARLAVDRMLERVGHETLANVPRMELVRRDLLNDALELYRGFLARRGQDAQLDRDVADTHGRIADVHGLLGDYASAARSIDSALEVWMQHLERAPDDREARIATAELWIRRARIERLTGDDTSAATTCAEAIVALNAWIDGEPDVPELRRLRAVTYRELAESERLVGRWSATFDALEAALVDLDSCDAPVERMRTRLRYGTIANESAELVQPSQRSIWSAAAGEHLAAALDGVDRLLGQNPDDAQLRRDRVRALINFAVHRLTTSGLEGAQTLVDEALAASEELVGDYPHVSIYAADRLTAHLTAANAELMRGRFDRATELLAVAVESGQGLLERRPDDADIAVPLAYASLNQGAIAVTVGRPADALGPTRRAIELLRAVFTSTPTSPIGGHALRGAHRIEAHALLALGRIDEAAIAAEAMASADHGIAGPYRAAVLLGRCVEAVERAEGLERTEWVEDAVRWLRVAVERGATAGDLREPDLDPLRGRAAFAAWVGEAVGP